MLSRSSWTVSYRMGSSSQLYSLSWGEFSSSLTSAVQLLRGHGDLVDVTLAAGGRSFPAHKIVLCAASPFLLDLLKVIMKITRNIYNFVLWNEVAVTKYFIEYTMPTSSSNASRDWSRWFGVSIGICISRRGKRWTIAVAFSASGCSLPMHPWVNTTDYSNRGMMNYVMHIICFVILTEYYYLYDNFREIFQRYNFSYLKIEYVYLEWRRNSCISNTDCEWWIVKSDAQFLSLPTKT